VAIAQLGKREHVDILEPLLEDKSSCVSPQPQLPGQLPATVQVRDVALVVMLQLTDQRPADYGYLNVPAPSLRNIQQIQTLYRETDEQRDEAISKWRQWRASEKRRVSNRESSKPKTP
jgi:hypothetical protein